MVIRGFEHDLKCISHSYWSRTIKCGVNKCLRVIYIKKLLVPLLLTLFCQINYLRPMFQKILIFVINSGQLSETDKFTDNYQFYILKIINLHI